MAPQTRSSTARTSAALSSRAQPSRKRSLHLSGVYDSTKVTIESEQQSSEVPEDSEAPEDLEVVEEKDDDIAALNELSSNNLRLDLEPITNVHHAFKDLLSKRQSEIIGIANGGGFQLRVGTMCSGTEAPIFALKLIKDMSRLFLNDRPFMQFDHLFSVEIVPFKQAYISRNAPGSTVFHDVVDFADPDAPAARTIMGYHCDIPDNIDLLVAGTSCVDFSTLNTRKKNSMQLMTKGVSLVEEWKNSDQNPANNRPAKEESFKKNSSERKHAKKGPADEKPANPLREGYFDEVNEWLSSITPAEIETTGKTIGESSTTFLSTVCYINRHRPKMVILENVIGAPWSSMCGLFLRAIGYAATYTFLDTKDYYIPHTRKRGYVVALDRENFGESVDHILDEWLTQMVNLERGASSPVQDWLLSSQDPLTIRARQDESEKAVASGLNSGRESQWDRSKLRHARIRRQFELGNGRPLTAWGRGGIEKPYDRIDKLILKGQNNRALDCVDIYYLRCLHAGSQPMTGPMQYDIRFKSQIFDLSQNIDRGQITRNFGVTGCLTPRGLNLITDQGRLVSGYEALNLQGLPLRDLDLSGESQDELRDLAGNAMTTTVVGAVIFSLLIAVHLRANKTKPLPLTPITEEQQAVLPYRPLYQPPFIGHAPADTWHTTLEPFHNVQGVINLSKRCRRYCYCNGGAKYSTCELVRCEICNTIRCTSCEGNPIHQFVPLPSIRDPIANDIVPREIMKQFPTALKDIISEAIHCIPFTNKTPPPPLQTRLLKSLRSVTFNYYQVLLSENITICYSAKDDDFSFRLQAVISEKWVIWYLFLDPWSRYGRLLIQELGLNAAQMLRPFGRIRISPQASGFMPRQNAWEFWMFTKVNFKVNVTKHDPNFIEIGRVALENLPSATHADIRAIVGTYLHHPECDAAEDSLHAIVDDTKRYLFKDPARIGPVQDDSYIISDECRFLEKHEFRDFCVKFSHDWAPQTTEALADVFITGYWEMAVSTPSQSEFLSQNTLISYTRQAGLCSIPLPSEVQSNNVGHRVRTLASVCIESNRVADAFMTLLKYEQEDPKNWAVVSRSDHSALFDLLAPANVNLDIIETEISLPAMESPDLRYPRLPQAYWMEKTTGGPNVTIREPYRLSSEMRRYAQCLQSWGEPLQIAVNISDSQNKEGWKRVTANYEINIDLLAHAALNHLPKPKYNAEGDGAKESIKVKTCVRVEKGSLNIPNLRFKSFRNSLKRLPGQTSQGGSGFSNLFIDGYALTKQQEISLNWMLGRELKPPSFTELEIEECRFDPLSLRVVAVVRRDISQAGGILADDVGYGKTVLSLALMAARQKADEDYVREKPYNEGEKTLALAASLVLVPRHLVNQWCDEAAKFLGWKGTDVLTIRSSRNLQEPLRRVTSAPPSKKTRTTKTSMKLLDKLKAAKLIIVSTAIFDDNYYTWLGKFSGSLAHPQAIPRSRSSRDTANSNVLGAFQDWYEDATEYARRHISGFDSAVFGPNQLETIRRRQQSLQDSWKKVVDDHYDTTIRLGRGVKRADKTGKYVKDSKEEATVQKEYCDTARASVFTVQEFEANEFVHVLEAFNFARVIYDEFSYENFCVAQFLRNAKTRAKWVLSATPPTSNVKAVCDIGELLGIHVARPVKLRPGLPLITVGPTALRQDPTEKQLSYGKLYTDKSVYERVEQTHEFLRHFASANPFDEEGLGKIMVSETARCSYMTRRQLIKYLDIQQDLRNSDLEISNVLKHHNLDSNFLVEFPSEGRLRAGLALAYVASVDCTECDGRNDELILSREKDLEIAQKKLNDITKVAIWLVLRRSEEQVNKKNDSATSGVQDLAWHLGSILEKDTEAFGGAEALKAVTNSTFSEQQFKVCSEWWKKADKSRRNSEDFFQDLFTLLKTEMGLSTWATYFRLSKDRMNSLQPSEISDRIQELGGQNPAELTPADCRKHLQELIDGKLLSADSRPRASENGPEATAKRKGRTRPKSQPDNPGEAIEYSDKNKPEYPRFNVRIKIRGGDYTETESELCDILLSWMEAKDEVLARARQVTTAKNLLCSEEMRVCSACEHSCDDMYFLPECGHFICSSHLSVTFCGEIKSVAHMNGSGCPAPIPQRTIPVKQIDLCPMETDKKLLRGNPKSLMILSTIRGILNGSNEKLLVFYQFDKQKQEICHLLQQNGIAFEDYSGTAAEASTSNQKSTSQRVRILKLNSEEAAGSNFQDANHVLFVSTPVFGKQEDFEKYVKQAKGRAIRHGQLKDVNVHYFVTANTFEVDLLQLRKKSHIRKGEGDTAYFAPMNGDAHRNPDSEGDTNMADAPDASS